MVFLVCELTPPRKGLELANLTPTAFLLSEDAMSPVKRKAHFKRLSTEDLKKFKLDPMPEAEDVTIMLYHKRIQAQMPKDREKLQVQIPFDDVLSRIGDLKVIKIYESFSTILINFLGFTT